MVRLLKYFSTTSCGGRRGVEGGLQWSSTPAAAPVRTEPLRAPGGLAGQPPHLIFKGSRQPDLAARQEAVPGVLPDGLRCLQRVAGGDARVAEEGGVVGGGACRERSARAGGKPAALVPGRDGGQRLPLPRCN